MSVKKSCMNCEYCKATKVAGEKICLCDFVVDCIFLDGKNTEFFNPEEKAEECAIYEQAEVMR